MIRRAFQHLPGIGRERLARLQEAGIRDWKHLLDQSRELLGVSDRNWRNLTVTLQECLRAFEADDLRYFVHNCDRRDHWRILASYFDRATFFDIETTGLECDSEITIIACYHNGEFHRFFKNENLEAFLDLLEEVKLLVSFNGNSFDVPKVERAFHIPELPCPHLDLRWVCYHAGLRGGLKKIEQRLGILRPPDLAFVDGEEAVWLWERWEESRDVSLRERLERYCCADVAALHMVGAELLKRVGCPVDCKSSKDIWGQLNNLIPARNGGASSPAASPSSQTTVVDTPSSLNLSGAEQRLRRQLRKKRRNSCNSQAKQPMQSPCLCRTGDH